MEETFGQRLSRIRKEKGMTQEDIAKRIVISPQAVSKWENDVSSPDILVLSSLADILGVTVDELLGRNTTSNAETVESEVVHDEERMTEDSDEEDERDNEKNEHKSKSGIHLKDGDDEIIIDESGIHLTDGNDSVHINGHININSDDKKVVIDEDGVHTYSKHGCEVHTGMPKKAKRCVITSGIMFGFALIAYIIMGLIWTDGYMGWKCGWLLLLVPAVAESLIDAIIDRKITTFVYPLLVVGVYLLLGFLGDYFGFEGWGYFWFLFLTIPAFYCIAGPIDASTRRFRHQDLDDDD